MVWSTTAATTHGISSCRTTQTTVMEWVMRWIAARPARPAWPAWRARPGGTAHRHARVTVGQSSALT